MSTLQTATNDDSTTENPYMPKSYAYNGQNKQHELHITSFESEKKCETFAASLLASDQISARGAEPSHY